MHFVALFSYVFFCFLFFFLITIIIIIIIITTVVPKIAYGILSDTLLYEI